MTGTSEHDVVVVGGGGAGLSGAVALAWSRRTVLVVDAGINADLVAEEARDAVAARRRAAA